jgi:hypothetical protein
MADLLAGVDRVKPGEQLAEEFVELFPTVGRQMGPHGRQVGRWGWGRLQARGGVRRRVVSDMRFLR